MSKPYNPWVIAIFCVFLLNVHTVYSARNSYKPLAYNNKILKNNPLDVVFLNDAPIAVDDNYVLDEGSSLTTDLPNGLLINDTDTESDPLTVELVSGTANGVLTLSPDGTFSYTHNGTETTSDSFTYRVYDGVNYSNDATVSLSITPVNDEPILQNIHKNGTEDVTLNFAAADFTSAYTDNEESDLVKIKIETLPTNGTLKLASANITAGQEILLANLGSITFKPDDNWFGITTLIWNASDGTDYALAEAIVNISIAAVNDAPTLSAFETSTLAYTENGAAVNISSAIAVADTDNSTLAGASVAIVGYVGGQDELTFANTASITGTWNAATGTMTLAGVASLANYDAAIRDVKYQNTSDSPATTARQLSVTVYDGEANSTAATRNLAVTAVNDAPTLSAFETSTLAYNENGAAVNISSAIAVADADNGTLAGASVAIVGYVGGQDELTFANTASITGTWNAATGTMTLAGVASLANYDAAIRDVKYQNTSDSPATTARQLSVTVYDGEANSTAATRNLAVTAVNDAPTLSAFETSTLAYTENGAAVNISSAIAVADADNGTLAGASVAIVGYVGGQDELTFANTASITGTWNAATGTMTLAGVASLANYDAAIRDVKYQNTSDSPASTARQLSVTVYDGEANSTAATRNLAVTAVNDAPILTNINKNGTEDETLAFTGTDFTSAFVDIEGSPLVKVKIATLPNNGTLKLASINITAGQEILQANLGSIAFEPNADWFGNTSFAWNASDGTDYAATNATANIAIAAVNDAPTVTNFEVTGNEDVRLFLPLSSFSAHFNDIDGNSLHSIKFTELPLNGTLKLTNSNIALGDEILAANIPNINFAPNLDWYGTTTCKWTASDGTSFAVAPATATLTVTSVNDVPTLAEINKTGTEDVTLTFSDTDFATAFVDVESPLSNIKIITLPSNGTLKLSGTNVTLNAEVGAALLNNLTFVPTTDWNGNTSFEWNGSDGTDYATDNSLVKISIAAVNDIPTVANFTVTGTEDIDLPFGKTNFTHYFTDVENTLSKVQILTLPTNGTLKLSGTPVLAGAEIAADDLDVLVFVPNLNWNGITTFTWNGSDGTAFATTSATVTISVAAANDAPIFTSLPITSGTQNENYSYTITTTDVENQTMTITMVTKPSWLTFTNVSNGLATLTGTPAQANVGTHAVTIRVSDGSGYSDQLFNISVANMNDKPQFTSAPITSATEDVLYTYNITTFDLDGTTPNITIDEKPAWMNFTDNDNGTATLTGTPANDNAGTHHVILRVSDGLLDDTQEFDIAVANVNDAPVINSQKTLTTTEDTPIAVNLSDLNVTDVDNSYPTGFSLTLGTGSNYSISGNTVTPNANYNGTLTVAVRVNDGQSTNNLSNWFDLLITVTPVNDPPSLSGFETSTLAYTENSAATNISSTIAVADVDNSTLTGASIAIAGYASGQDELTFANTASVSGTWNSTTGVMTLTGVTTLANYNTAIRSVKYQNTSDNPATSVRQLSVTVNDGAANSNAVTRNLTVTAVNDAPVATSFSVSTKENVEKTIDINTYVTDAESNISWSTLTVTQAPGHGTIAVNTSAHTITYTPTTGYSGSDSFIYRVCDSENACTSGTVTVLISNEAPEPQNDNATTNEDASVTIDVLQNDTDPQNNIATATLKIMVQPTKGSVQILANSSVKYTPNANAYGDDSFYYEICDNTGYCSEAKVSITINALNDAPNVAADAASTDEDTSMLIDVLANDNDTNDPQGGIDPATLTISVVPLHGTAVVESGKIRYTPVTNYNGSDTFSYSVGDKGYPLPSISRTASVAVTVNAVNDKPVITGQQPLSTNEDAPLIVTLANLAVTDVDNTYPQGFTLTVLNGTNYTANSNQIIPSANYYGTLTVPVKVSDGSSQNATSDVFNLTITVNAVNDAPIAGDDMVYTGENTPINFSVLGNDSDPYDPLGGINASSLTIIKSPKNGSAVILPNQNINYTPFAGFYGKDTLQYQISDLGYPLPAKSATAYVFIEVFRLSPQANNDVANTNEDTAVSIDLLANDTDSGNDINPASITIITVPTKGTLGTPSGGKVTYTPSLNDNGTDYFTYTVKDFTNLTSNVARVDITILPVNDAPVAQSSSFNTRENVAITIPFASVMGDEDNNINYQTVVATLNPTNGSLVVDKANKQFGYQPATSFTGSDKFKFKVSDSNGLQSNEGTITIVVSNQAPTAKLDEFTTLEDVVLNMNVVQNDTDPQNNINPLSVTIVTQPKLGKATVNTSNGYIQYIPNTNVSGKDSLEYSVCDTDGYCDVAKVKITITPVNDAPVAVNDLFDLNEDGNGTFSVLQNDVDPENNIDLSTLSIVSNPASGVVTVNLLTGTVTYKPMHDFNGADSFTYKVCDTSGDCSNVATVNINVIAVNDAPDAIADVVKCYSGTPITLSLWLNDVDVDNNLSPATTTLTSNPLHGTAVVKPNGTVVYTAAADYTGPDTFEYQICDTSGDCDKAWVTITVYSGNVAPLTTADYATTLEDVTCTVLPLSNDTDPNDNLDPSTLKITVQPQHGTLQLNVGSSSVVYTPTSNYHGADFFVYEVCDNDFNMVLCATDTVYVTVTSVNDKPLAVDDAFTGTDNVANQFNILANDTDVDGDILTASLIGNVSFPDITVLLAPTGNLTVTPALGAYCRNISFYYKTCDNAGSCDTAMATIVIVPLDSDHDNIPDAVETLTKDSDGDNIPNYLDTDSDDDAIGDQEEGGIEDMCADLPTNTDNDAKPDYMDTDSDNDGVTDKVEGNGDCDNDGAPNYRDYFDDCNNRLKVPETFSPNNDGVNDHFVIPIITDYPQNELTVFNRWGGEVYHKVNYDNSWDGRSSTSMFGSDILPEGTYFYILKLGNELTLKGTVYIKR